MGDANGEPTVFFFLTLSTKTPHLLDHFHEGSWRALSRTGFGSKYFTVAHLFPEQIQLYFGKLGHGERGFALQVLILSDGRLTLPQGLLNMWVVTLGKGVYACLDSNGQE